jgi:hypothetical protein
MSDACIYLVPKISDYPDRQAKAVDITSWLITEEIIKPTTIGSVVGPTLSYTIGSQAGRVVTKPALLPFQIIPNGLEVITETTVFSAELDELICPNCKNDIASEDWDLMPWLEQESTGLTCPRCMQEAAIHQFTFEPAWGFSNLGFCFWNWPTFTEQFIQGFEQKLGCAVSVINQRI